MPSPFAHSPEFLRLVEGTTSVSLPRVALEIARDAEPSLDIEAYLGRIDALADRVRLRRGDPRPRAVLGQINWVLFVEEGMRGNVAEYHDPSNSYLNEVLDRRTGIPISLSILYAAVAEPLGLGLSGVNLPAHYLLRLDGSDPPLFVDPFHEGAFLDRAGCERRVSQAMGRPVKLDESAFAPCDARTTVARMLRNLMAIHAGADDPARSLVVARRLGVIEPDQPETQRDWGLLAYRAGRPGEALAPLGHYLELVPDAADIPAIVEVLRSARREVTLSN